MSKKQQTLSDYLIPALILLAILHYFAAGLLAPMSYKECRSSQADYNTSFSSCAKSKLRASPYLEFAIYSALTENKNIAWQIAQGVNNIKQTCKRGVG